MNRLEQLKRMTRVVADTGDPEAIRKYQPLDATTNPSLLLKAATIPGYEPLLADAVEWSARHPGGDRLERCIEKLSVGIGCEILQHIPGSVSTEVSARLSFDEDEIVACAERIIRLYNDAGIGNDRVLVKVASTWQGIRAAARLESQGIHCNLTLLFGFAQAVACAEAGVTLISPFVGRIYDWYKAKTGQDDFAPDEDPGVKSVRRIFNYYKTYGYDTIVMGASFRKAEQIVALAGCDQLTISPPLLEELAASEQPLALALDSGNPGEADEALSLDEIEFHWYMNEDAMATEKLAEGIRNFYADELRLRDYLASRF